MIDKERKRGWLRAGLRAVVEFHRFAALQRRRMGADDPLQRLIERRRRDFAVIGAHQLGPGFEHFAHTVARRRGNKRDRSIIQERKPVVDFGAVCLRVGVAS